MEKVRYSFFLNAGSMLMRSSLETLEFVNRVREYGEAKQGLSEQDCMRDAIELGYETTESGRSGLAG